MNVNRIRLPAVFLVVVLATAVSSAAEEDAGWLQGATQRLDVISKTGEARIISSNRGSATFLIWCSEGLAEYFATVQFVENRAIVGGPIEHHLSLLGSNRWLSSSRLFAISGVSPEYDETDLSGSFYAQSWLLTDYVLSGGHGHAVTPHRLLALAGGDRGLHDQMLSLLDLNIHALEGRLREYAFGDSFKTVSYPVTATVDRELPIRAADPVEVETTLGELMLFVVKDLKGAEAHLSKAETMSAGRARTSSLLALLRSRQGQDERAVTRFEALLEAHPQNARIPLLYGISQLEKLERESGTLLVPSGTAPSLALEARALLQRSLELEPGNPEALARLGSTFVLSPHEDPAPGIAALEAARDALGDRLDVVTSLALLYTSAGRLTQGAALLIQIKKKSSDPRHLAEVERATSMAKQRAAELAWQRGHYQLSIDILESLLAETGPGDARERLVKAIEERKRVGSYNQCVDRFNEAVELANGGRLDAASEIVGSLKMECKETDLKDEIWQLGNGIDARRP